MRLSYEQFRWRGHWRTGSSVGLLRRPYSSKLGSALTSSHLVIELRNIVQNDVGCCAHAQLFPRGKFKVQPRASLVAFLVHVVQSMIPVACNPYIESTTVLCVIIV